MANMFDENGNYNKTEWKPGDRITAGKLNKIEESLEAINNNDIERHKEADERLDALEEQNEAVEERFDELEDLVADNKSEVDTAIYEVHSKMDRLEQEMNDGIDEVHNVAETVDGKIASADASMKAQVAEVKADLEGLHAKDDEITSRLEHKTNIEITENIINQNYSKLFDKIKSVNMYVPYNTNEFDDYQTLINKAIEVGCNYISFCPRLAMTEKTSNSITRSADDELLKKYIDYAISKGLKIILKPHIFITNGDISGSSNIQPTDLSLWIKSLQDNLVYYYTLLGNKISIISISNECTHQNDKNLDDWTTLINTLKGLNSNILTTVAVTDVGIETNVVYPLVDIIGCNLYIGLKGNKSTPINILRKSIYDDFSYDKDFITKLLKISRELNKPILITETGCLPYSESLNTPGRWDYPPETPKDEDIQVIYYKTVLPTYINSKRILGCSIWSLTDGFTFNNRKAEQTLKDIYGGVYNV